MLLLVSMRAQADGQFDIRPFASAAMTYDDNVFRFANSNQAFIAFGSHVMSDRMLTKEAGVNVDWKISNQHLILGIDLNQTSFNRFSYLDSRGGNNKITWDWSIGNHLSGVLSMGEQKAMAGFNDVHNTVLNVLTTDNQLMSLNWDFHPSWRLHLQFDQASYHNGLAANHTANSNNDAQEIALQYTTGSGNLVSLSARENKTKYPDRDPISTALFGNSNQQRDLGVSVVWQPLGKTTISSRLGWVERKYEVLQQRDVSDWTGQINMSWQATGKTAFQATAVHDISAIEGTASTYVQSERVTLNPSWMPTSKITVQGNLQYEDRSYLGDPGFYSVQGPQREDKLLTAGMVVTYMPYDKVRTQLTVQKVKSDSSFLNYGYMDSSIAANVRLDF